MMLAERTADGSRDEEEMRSIPYLALYLTIILLIPSREVTIRGDMYRKLIYFQSNVRVTSVPSISYEYILFKGYTREIPSTVDEPFASHLSLHCYYHNNSIQ